MEGGSERALLYGPHGWALYSPYVPSHASASRKWLVGREETPEATPNRVAREVTLPSPHTTEHAGPHSAVQVG